jgi:hypothetical protein
MKHETKDSGKKAVYSSGMKRDDDTSKPHFEYLFVKGIPYNEQLITRWAELMQRGALKYGNRNFENARTEEELERYKSSALRHLMQWVMGETDEDHASAVMFNLMCAEMVRYKLDHSDTINLLTVEEMKKYKLNS